MERLLNLVGATVKHKATGAETAISEINFESGTVKYTNGRHGALVDLASDFILVRKAGDDQDCDKEYKLSARDVLVVVGAINTTLDILGDLPVKNSNTIELMKALVSARDKMGDSQKKIKITKSLAEEVRQWGLE